MSEVVDEVDIEMEVEVDPRMEYYQTEEKEPDTSAYKDDEQASVQEEDTDKQAKIITDPTELGAYAAAQGVELGDEFTYNDKTYVYHRIFQQPFVDAIATDVEDILGAGSAMIDRGISAINEEFVVTMEMFEQSTHSEMRSRMSEEVKPGEGESQDPGVFWNTVRWLQAMHILPIMGSGAAGYYNSPIDDYFGLTRDEVKQLMDAANDVFRDEAGAIQDAYDDTFDSMMEDVLPGRRNALRATEAENAADKAAENMADYYKKQQLAYYSLRDSIWKIRKSMGSYKFSAYKIKHTRVGKMTDSITSFATRFSQSAQGFRSQDKYVQTRSRIASDTLTPTYKLLFTTVSGILGGMMGAASRYYWSQGVGYVWNDPEKMTVAERVAHITSEEYPLSKVYLNNDKMNRAVHAFDMLEYKKYGLTLTPAFKKFYKFNEDIEQESIIRYYTENIVTNFMNTIGVLKSTKMDVLISKAKQTFEALDDESKLRLCGMSKFQKACSVVDPSFPHNQ